MVTCAGDVVIARPAGAAEALAAGVAASSSLVELVLTRCGIGDEGAKALELSGGFVTPKNAIGRALIRGSFTHHYAFDAKAVQFKESHVIVCEDAAPPPGEPRIVGERGAGLQTPTPTENQVRCEELGRATQEPR